jgi:hypothetical protein
LRQLRALFRAEFQSAAVASKKWLRRQETLKFTNLVRRPGKPILPWKMLIGYQSRQSGGNAGMFDFAYKISGRSVAGQGEYRRVYCLGKNCLKNKTHDDKFLRVVYTFVSGKAVQWAD